MDFIYKNLDDLEYVVSCCNKCALSFTRHNVVFGEGNPNARLMFIGEGPGFDEDRTGRPFVGKAGKLLDEVFNEVGIDRKDIYIANIIKCRPPQNRNPKDDEMDNCIDYLRNQVMLIKPEIIVILGSVALKRILGKDYFITKDRGKWVKLKKIKYMPTFHPAAVLRDESKKADLIDDLKLVVEELELN